jgi:hypothetical protein
MRRGLVVAGLAAAVLAGSQSQVLAGPVTFATFASVPGGGGLNLSSDLTELSVGAIVDYTQLIPPILAPATPTQFIYFSILPTTLATAPISNGVTETWSYGAGTFDFTFVDPVASTFTPILQGTFANLFLVAPAGGGFSVGGATATLSGLAFELSGLVNTGTLLFTLGAPVFNAATGGYEYSIPYGELTAQPVPEPASSWLLGVGIAAVCAFQRRRR